MGGTSVTDTEMKQVPPGPDTFWARYGWLLAAVWIIFLIYPITTVAASDLNLTLSIVAYGTIASFAAIYLVAFYKFSGNLDSTPDAQVYLYFALLIGVALGTIPLIGVNVFGFGPFIISFSAYLLSVRWMWWTSALTLGSAIAVALIGNLFAELGFLIGLLVVLTIANAVNVTLIRRSIAADALHQNFTILSEQDRMARDVHDVLGHSLTAVSLKAELAERLLDTDIEKAREELQQIRALTLEALDSIRTTVGGLRRTTLEEELHSAREALRDAGIATMVVDNAEKTDIVRSHALSWILRESVTNVLRHAHAASCWITIEEDALSIEDDGDSISGTREGHGIRGMRERARLAGAELSIGESTHGGTKIAVRWN